MNATTIISLVLLFISYLLLQYYIKDKHKIQSSLIQSWTKNRRFPFVLTNLLMICGGIILHFILYPNIAYPMAVRMLPLFLILFSVPFISGIERWMTQRREKEYLSQWLSAGFVFSAYAMLVILEQLYKL
ncbi:hypothetical protein J416_12954 [Gracilibacillus halophilus YIM-C55.5]|uniref:DUF4181 domain-containing protein n=1 Tax=Gracilibacillus halophilus YIM-C55.5 TaxID=1308866 RepID=N4WS96_9BACI|nr:hypothetical protein [Gracilibacillus halophilus]ENH96036.1 hypothetical protein J416_12954 [Gracilibacillus halophilus YIM-C55.5]